MGDDRRGRLIRLIANIEQQLAEAESLTTEATDDDILHGASNELAQLRQMLANLEAKLISQSIEDE